MLVPFAMKSSACITNCSFAKTTGEAWACFPFMAEWCELLATDGVSCTNVGGVVTAGAGFEPSDECKYEAEAKCLKRWDESEPWTLQCSGHWCLKWLPDCRWSNSSSKLSEITFPVIGGGGRIHGALPQKENGTGDLTLPCEECTWLAKREGNLELVNVVFTF